MVRIKQIPNQNMNPNVYLTLRLQSLREVVFWIRAARACSMVVPYYRQTRDRRRPIILRASIINYIPTKTDEERMMPIIQRKPATISDLILLFNDNPTWSTIFPQVKRLISLFCAFLSLPAQQSEVSHLYEG